MGTSTPHLDLYKPAPVGELVDVTTHINENLDKIDAATLSLDGRLETVEAITEINTWTAWEPDVKLGDVVIASGITAEFLKLGTLVFCSVEIEDIPIANYDPYNFEISLPFEVLKGVSGGAIHAGTTTSDLGFLKERFMLATRNQRNSGALTVLTDKMMIYPVIEFSSSIQTAPQGSIEFTTLSDLTATFQYRTNNIPVA